jgi:transcriptional regulator with XRE-family HTH domain
LPSKLGEVVRMAREDRGIGLRDLARRIDKSPTLLVMLEKNDPAPGVSEETLRGIARELSLNADHLLTLAGKTPDDVVPSDELEVAIFRLVKGLPSARKQAILAQLRGEAQ